MGKVRKFTSGWVGGRSVAGAWLKKIQREALALEAPQEGIKKLTRREWLQTVGSWAGCAYLGSSLLLSKRLWAQQIHQQRQQPDHTQSPVMILGGGLAGLSAAYWLSQAGIPCAVYEGSNRWGGRVYTKNKALWDGKFCELGGELIDSNHDDMFLLAESLGLSMDDFQLGSEHLEKNLYYNNDRYYFHNDMVRAFAPLARQIQRDLHFYQGSRAQELDRMNLEEYLHLCDQRSHQGLESWLLRFLKTAYTGEFGSEPSEIPASLFVSFIGHRPGEFQLYGDSDERFRINGGNSRLIEALVRALEQAGVSLHLGHRLVSWSQTSSGDQRLGFQNTNNPSGGTQDVSAHQVICSLPFSRLRDVEGLDSLGWSQSKLYVIQEFDMGSNAKIMTAFQRPIWRDDGILVRAASAAGSRLGAEAHMTFTGSFVSDHGEHWDSGRGQQSVSPASVALDPSHQQCSLGNRRATLLTNLVGGRSAFNLNTENLQSRYTAWQNHIDEIFPRCSQEMMSNEVTHSRAPIVFNWSQHEWSGGSWASTKPGQAHFYEEAGRPENHGRVLFAGEHTSVEFGGFMNGAAQSGRQAARALIGRRMRG